MARRSRTEKYPNNKYYEYFNANPHGRITGDCVFRAISLALDIPYNEVVMEMAKVMCKTGYSLVDAKGFGKYLELKGWKKNPQLKHSDGKKYTVKDFVQTHQKGTYLINMAGHLSVIKNGKNYDIWDCVKYGGCVGNYWTK